MHGLCKPVRGFKSTSFKGLYGKWSTKFVRLYGEIADTINELCTQVQAENCGYCMDKSRTNFVRLYGEIMAELCTLVRGNNVPLFMQLG